MFGLFAVVLHGGCGKAENGDHASAADEDDLSPAPAVVPAPSSPAPSEPALSGGPTVNPDDIFPSPTEQLPRPADDRPLNRELVNAFQLIDGGQMPMARLELSDYIRANPDDGRAHFLLGLSYHQEFRYGSAQQHFEQAAQLAPSYHPIWHFYGWCLYHLGEHDLARRAFQTHLEFVPTEGDSHFAIGLIDLDEDHLDDAEARFRKAIEYQQDQPGRAGSLANAHARLGEVYLRRDNLEAARLELETAIETYPDQFEAMHQLFRVLSRLGEDEKAEQMLERYEQTKARVRPRRSYEE